MGGTYRKTTKRKEQTKRKSYKSKNNKRTLYKKKGTKGPKKTRKTRKTRKAKKNFKGGIYGEDNVIFTPENIKYIETLKDKDLDNASSEEKKKIIWAKLQWSEYNSPNSYSGQHASYEKYNKKNKSFFSKLFKK
jgi:hypothetical protein